MLAHTCRFGLEGIISKRKDLPYRPGRGHHWFKAKCMQSQEFVILGYVPSTAARGAVGSLSLGYYSDGGLVYAGRVGTGWSADLAISLRKDLDKIRAGEAGAAQASARRRREGRRLGRAAPRLRGRISRLDPRRADPATRHSRDCGTTSRRRRSRSRAPQKRSKARADSAASGVKLTHPERILWAEPGITKQGLADFYTDIADWILPHVTDRVLSLLRCPSGTSAKCFFAKHPWAGLTDDVQRVDGRHRAADDGDRQSRGPAQSGAGRRGRNPSLGIARRRSGASGPPDLRSRSRRGRAVERGHRGSA